MGAKRLDKKLTSERLKEQKLLSFSSSDDKESRELSVHAFNQDGDLKRKVTRGEFIDVMRQIGDNMNQISSYLMEDVNTMYAKQVFPFQVQMAVLEDLLIEKKIITRKELDKGYHDRLKELQEKARAIKEENGEQVLATKEEDDKLNKEAVVRALRQEESSNSDSNKDASVKRRGRARKSE